MLVQASLSVCAEQKLVQLSNVRSAKYLMKELFYYNLSSVLLNVDAFWQLAFWHLLARKVEVFLFRLLERSLYCSCVRSNGYFHQNGTMIGCLRFVDDLCAFLGLDGTYTRRTGDIVDDLVRIVGRECIIVLGSRCIIEDSEVLLYFRDERIGGFDIPVTANEERLIAPTGSFFKYDGQRGLAAGIGKVEVCGGEDIVPYQTF